MYGGTGLSPFHCISYILMKKVTLLFVIGFLCFVLNCVYTHDAFFVSNCLSNLINYIWLNIIIFQR